MIEYSIDDITIHFRNLIMITLNAEYYNIVNRINSYITYICDGKIIPNPRKKYLNIISWNIDPRIASLYTYWKLLEQNTFNCDFKTIIVSKHCHTYHKLIIDIKKSEIFGFFDRNANSKQPLIFDNIHDAFEHQCDILIIDEYTYFDMTEIKTKHPNMAHIYFSQNKLINHPVKFILNDHTLSCHKMISQNKIKFTTKLTNITNSNQLMHILNRSLDNCHLKKVLMICKDHDVDRYYNIYVNNHRKEKNFFYRYHNLYYINAYKSSSNEDFLAFCDLYSSHISLGFSKFSRPTHVTKNHLKYGSEHGILITSTKHIVTDIHNVDCIINLDIDITDINYSKLIQMLFSSDNANTVCLIDVVNDIYCQLYKLSRFLLNSRLTNDDQYHEIYDMVKNKTIMINQKVSSLKKKKFENYIKNIKLRS